MTEVSSQEWFLEINGTKTGPFSTEQVLGLLQDKEIPETQRVTCEALAGRWILVQEIASFQNAPSSAPSSGASSAAASPPTVPVDRVEDTALQLFDALQAAKDRKPPRAALPPVDEPAKSNPFVPRNIPKKVWALGAVGLGLLAAVWAMVSLIQTKTPPGKSTPVDGFSVSGGTSASSNLTTTPVGAGGGHGYSTAHSNSAAPSAPSSGTNSVGNASNAMPPSLNSSNDERDRERDIEMERERERERERSNDGNALPPPPPPPPLPEPQAQPMDPGILNNNEPPSLPPPPPPPPPLE